MKSRLKSLASNHQNKILQSVSHNLPIPITTVKHGEIAERETFISIPFSLRPNDDDDDTYTTLLPFKTLMEPDVPLELAYLSSPQQCIQVQHVEKCFPTLSLQQRYHIPLPFVEYKSANEYDDILHCEEVAVKPIQECN